MSLRGSTFEHIVKYPHCFSSSLSAVDVTLLDVSKSEVDRREHFLEVVGAYLKSACERYFVISVVGCDDSEVVTNLLVNVGVQAELSLIGCAVERVLGCAGID